MHHVPCHWLIAHIPGLAAQTSGRVLHHGKCLWQDFFQHALLFIRVFDGGQALFPRKRPRAQCVIGLAGEVFVDLIDACHDREHPADFALIFRADDFFNYPVDHVNGKKLSASGGRMIFAREANVENPTTPPIKQSEKVRTDGVRRKRSCQ